MSTLTEGMAFDRGILWAAARLVEFHDEPTMAAGLLLESGADVSCADELDRPFIQKALASSPGPERRMMRTITIDPDVRSGKPVLAGTRVPIAQILGELADGCSLPEISKDLYIEPPKLVEMLDELAALPAEVKRLKAKVAEPEAEKPPEDE